MKLITDNLVILRGDRIVIDGLSFDISGGDALLVTGANGAGKTTLLRALAGLLEPLSGTIRLDGGDPEHPLSEQCHYLGHANGVKASLTVAENLTFWAKYLGGPNDGESGSVDRALDRFALTALGPIPVRYLSAGQKRRAGLSRLLAAPRPVWLLDEPTAALDAASAGRLIEAIDGHTSGGGIAIVATHLPMVLEGMREVRLG